MAERWRDDEGSAVVEFVFLALVLMVPLVYLVVTLGAVQSAAFAAEAVARDASRAAVVAGVDALRAGEQRSDAEAAARERAAAAVDMTLADFHIDPADAEVTLDCGADTCLAPGSDVAVDVAIRVAIPGIGELIPGARFSVSSAGSARVDGYRP